MEVINKRSIGKLIVKFCGNEGQKDDETLVVTLRRILQSVITKLDTESEETWSNAEIVIYDQKGNDFCIRAGKAENKFVVQLDGKDEIDIRCTQREQKGFVESCKSQFRNFLASTSKKEAIEQSKQKMDISNTQKKESQAAQSEASNTGPAEKVNQPTSYPGAPSKGPE